MSVLKCQDDIYVLYDCHWRYISCSVLMKAGIFSQAALTDPNGRTIDETHQRLRKVNKCINKPVLLMLKTWMSCNVENANNQQEDSILTFVTTKKICFPKSPLIPCSLKAHLISRSPFKVEKSLLPPAGTSEKDVMSFPLLKYFPETTFISSAARYLSLKPAPVIVVTVVSSSFAASPNCSRTWDGGWSWLPHHHDDKDKEWGGVSHLIVHVVVEGIELVRPVEGDTSQAGMLRDGDRWVGEDGGDGGGGVGGEGAEGADHCSAVITEYSVARPGYTMLWKGGRHQCNSFEMFWLVRYYPVPLLWLMWCGKRTNVINTGALYLRTPGDSSIPIHPFIRPSTY